MVTKKIKDIIYNRDITLFYECNKEEFYECLEKKHKGLKLDGYFVCAEHISIDCPNTWVRHYIWIKQDDFSVKGCGTIMHEVFHCVRSCFDEIGMKITEETNEAFAYYQEYIFKEILKAFNYTS
jgi:hypothetical protein